MPRPMPVPAPPPGLTDVLRAAPGSGSAPSGSASRAAGSLFAARPRRLGRRAGRTRGSARVAPGRGAGARDRGRAPGGDGRGRGGRAHRRRRAPGRRDRRSCSAPCGRWRTRLWQLERGCTPRTDPEPGAGGGAHPGDRAAGHGERDRADRLRARRSSRSRSTTSPAPSTSRRSCSGSTSAGCIRESTMGLTTEAVDAVRVAGDRSRWSARALGRPAACSARARARRGRSGPS